MATLMDVLQLTHIYIPQTGSFCSYKDLPGILECSIAGVLTELKTTQPRKWKILLLLSLQKIITQ